MSDEEKNSMELDIEAKYAGRTEKEFLSNITYAECLYILDTKNKYCDAIKNLSLLKIVDIVNEQSKEIEELKQEKEYLNCIIESDKDNYINKDKIKAKIEEYDDKGMTVNLANRSAGKTFQQAVHYEVKEVLQSLLEKE